MQHLTWITCIEIIFKFLKESISEDHSVRFIDALVKKQSALSRKWAIVPKKAGDQRAYLRNHQKAMGLQSHEFNGFREGKW